MTPTRFRECLNALHWTQRKLARILGQPEGLVRQWARGSRPIPQDVAEWLQKLEIIQLQKVVQVAGLDNEKLKLINDRPFSRHQENG